MAVAPCPNFIAEKKIVIHKISLLKLAELLGNVTKACKIKGVSRSQLYKY